MTGAAYWSFSGFTDDTKIWGSLLFASGAWGFHFHYHGTRARSQAVAFR
jgi:hypothetical protein